MLRIFIYVVINIVGKFLIKAFLLIVLWNCITEIILPKYQLYNATCLIKITIVIRKGKTARKVVLDRVLFVAELEFPKILVPSLFYFLFNIKRQGLVNHRSSASSDEYQSKIKNLSKDTRRSLISRDGIGWKVKLTVRLNDHVIWVLNKVNMNEID